MQNLHMTVCFLGGIDATQQTFFDEALRGVEIEPITFHLNDFSYFSKSQVLWLGTQSTPATFQSLVDRCQRIANRARIRVEKRPLIPHITVARRVPPSVPSPLERRISCLRTNTLRLQEPRLTPDGPQYRTVLCCPGPTDSGYVLCRLWVFGDSNPARYGKTSLASSPQIPSPDSPIHHG